MDDIDRAQEREQKDRAIAIRLATNRPSRDLPGEICTGCDYATKSNWGHTCEAWRECLSDLQRRDKTV